MPTIKNSAGLATLAYEGYNPQNPGPVTITSATVTQNGTSRDVYIVALSGTDVGRANRDGQAVGVGSDALVGLGLPGSMNHFTPAVKQAMYEKIPQGANVILTGHSLGGMVAQQIAADRDIKRDYNITNTVTFGAPLIAPGQREGKVTRLGDTSDVVPLASVSGTVMPAWRDLGLNRESGGFRNPLNAHNMSYINPQIWKGYDALGQKGGNATITYDTQDVSRHPVGRPIPRYTNGDGTLRASDDNAVTTAAFATPATGVARETPTTTSTRTPSDVQSDLARNPTSPALLAEAREMLAQAGRTGGVQTPANTTAATASSGTDIARRDVASLAPPSGPALA